MTDNIGTLTAVQFHFHFCARLKHQQMSCDCLRQIQLPWHLPQVIF